MFTRKAAAAPSTVAHCRYSVQWSPEDQEFVAAVLEFPSLSWLDEDEFQALRSIEQLVSDVIDELNRSGEPVPEPIATQSLEAASTFGYPRNSIASLRWRLPITECP